MKLDADEKELLESVERGEWKSAGGGKREWPWFLGPRAHSLDSGAVPTDILRVAARVTRVRILDARLGRRLPTARRGRRRRSFQSSTFRPGTRRNSVVLCVTSVSLRALAWPAISTS